MSNTSRDHGLFHSLTGLQPGLPSVVPSLGPPRCFCLSPTSTCLVTGWCRPSRGGADSGRVRRPLRSERRLVGGTRFGLGGPSVHATKVYSGRKKSTPTSKEGGPRTRGVVGPEKRDGPGPPLTRFPGRMDEGSDWTERSRGTWGRRDPEG